MSEQKWIIRFNTDSPSWLFPVPDPKDQDILDFIHGQLDGGFMEIVRPRNLKRGYVMVIDDCGKLKGLDMNFVMSVLYDGFPFRDAICGTALIFKEDLVDGEPDLVAMDYAEAAAVQSEIYKKVVHLVNEGAKGGKK